MTITFRKAAADDADTDYTFQSSDSIVFDGNYYGENAKASNRTAACAGIQELFRRSGNGGLHDLK